jgi:Flp pilus assembly protein TadD
MRALAGVALAIATAWTFSGVLACDFLAFDDDFYVTGNAIVQRGLTLHGLGWALSTFDASNWHPATWLSHMLDVALFGLDPAGHHATSALLHVANAVLLYAWLSGATGAVGRSAFAAALFALHPMRAESVAWVAERKDVLCALFWTLALTAHARFARTGSRRAYAATLLAGALGLASKPMAVTLPVALLLTDVWPLRRLGPGAGPGAVALRRAIAEKLPLFALALGTSALTLAAQRGTIVPAELLPLDARVANALVAYPRYLAKLLYPAGLAVLYPRVAAWGWAPVLASGAALVAASALAARGARRRPWLLAGWFWFALTLVPTLGLVQVGKQSIADRYTYLPSIGLCWIAAWGATELVGQGGRLASRSPRSEPQASGVIGRARRALLAASAGAALAACALGTRVYVQRWSDTVTLFTHALEQTGENAVAQQTLGTVALKSGDVDGALRRYEESLRIDPNDGTIHQNYGLALVYAGRFEEAIPHQEIAVRQDPADAEAHFKLGFGYAMAGDAARAEAAYREGLRIGPPRALALEQLGVLLLEQGRFEEAIPLLRQALSLEPARSSAQRNLDFALARSARRPGR